MEGNGQSRTPSNPKGSGRTPHTRKHPAWKRLEETILGIATDRFWLEMNKLEGRDFIITYLSIIRFFKPEMARQIMAAVDDIPVIELVDGMKRIAANGKPNDGLPKDILK